MTGLTDEQAELLLNAALNLAVIMRDEIGEGVVKAARDLLDAAGGDPIAALGATAALIRTDQPLDRWWQTFEPIAPAEIERLLGQNELEPCGTHAAFNRHKKRGEPPCGDCCAGEKEYQFVRNLTRNRQRRARLAASGGGGVAA